MGPEHRGAGKGHASRASGSNLGRFVAIGASIGMPSQPLLLIEVTMTQTLHTAYDLVVLDLDPRTVTALADEHEIIGPSLGQ